LWVPLADIPEHVRKAFITAEDKRFLQHKGVDERGLIRAFIANLGAPGRPQGGSTITQQVAKNLLVGDDVTYERKIREMIVASRAETMLSKDDILELYLNTIYLGRGSWGIEMAARSYFGKPAKQLTLAEGALLAGLTKGPNFFSPERHPDRARGRLSYVLSRMQEDGVIDADTVKEANARLPAVVANERVRRDSGFYFVDQVAREAKSLNVAGLGVGASAVRTTIRPELQRAAESALQDGLARYEQMAGRAKFQGGETNLTDAITKLSAGPANDKPVWQRALEAVRLPLNDVHWTKAVVLSLAGKKDKTNDGLPRVGLADGRTMPLAVSGQQQRWLQLNDVVYVRISDKGKTGARAELRVRPTVQGAAVVLDNATGAILAVTGGFSYQFSQLNRATQSQRQPGSTLKPFTFLAALRHGMQPNTLVRDMPITLPPISGSQQVYSSSYIMADSHDKNWWTPKNYSGSGGGVTTLRRALEHSKNLVTANLLDNGIDAGPAMALRRVCELTQEAQVYKDCVPYYPFVLGAQPARLLDLAAFYAAVAMEGARPTPHVIEAIEQNGTAIYRYQTPSTWLGSGDRVSFYQLKSILQGVVARGTAASMARLSPYVAGKTGTSDDENDAWFIGFTNEVTIGVWVGYDNADGRRRTLGPGMTGGKVALPIFEPIVEAVWRDYARRTVLSPPSSLAARQMAAVPIDLGSGEPLQPGTPGAFTEYLRLDAARQLVDSRYSIVSRNEAFWARSYDPGSDGDLYGPYASRTGGGYYYGDNAPPIYGPQSPYPSQGGGSMFSNRGPFGGIFGDQRYFEQREYNRQQQRRVDPDYFINRFQTN